MEALYAAVDGRIDAAAIATCDDAMRDLAFDHQVLLDFWKAAPKDSTRSRQIRTALARVSSLLVDFTPEEVRQLLRVCHIDRDRAADGFNHHCA